MEMDNIFDWYLENVLKLNVNKIHLSGLFSWLSILAYSGAVSKSYTSSFEVLCLAFNDMIGSYVPYAAYKGAPRRATGTHAYHSPLSIAETH